MPRPAVFAFCALLALPAAAEAPTEDFGAWPPLRDPFPSTGGGGIMIAGYRPVLAGAVCTTDFEAVEPNGTRHRNTVVFEAVPAQGGILCTNGRWRSLTGDASGTTPFRVFIRDGVVRGQPL
ncbi:hypothetical protein [Plastoroseomonas hellenica]|uniref:hypothetical protein n=1 Tax=Plastoroseomonas hellenica TaxID=2687306 RepID=UPI001BA76E32|nr:hypothetical protein [Plastoroseomonas hellenica]MBR0643508.1 hypothetical protein [Plastoroseomonas hellenica]